MKHHLEVLAERAASTPTKVGRPRTSPDTPVREQHRLRWRRNYYLRKLGDRRAD